MSTESIVGLLLGGFAMALLLLFWNIQLAFGPYRRIRSHLLKRFLYGVAILAGIGFLLTIVLVTLDGSAVATRIFVALVLIGFVAVNVVMSVVELRAADRRALVWTLAAAAEKGAPLNDAARAFGDERSDGLGHKAQVLAIQLESGSPLPQALRASGNRLRIDEQLAVEAGTRMDILGPTFKRGVQQADELDALVRSLLLRFFYAFAIMFMTVSAIIWISVVIGPVMLALAGDFEVQFTTVSWLGSLGDVRPWIALLFPMGVLWMALLAISGLYYFGLLPSDTPGLAWLTQRLDGARSLRILSVAIEHDKPLGETLRLLAAKFPRSSVRRRLAFAGRAVTAGANWCDSLHGIGLIGLPELQVLKSAEKAGNLSWAASEMADRMTRRLIHRLQFWGSVAFPLLIFLCGAVVIFLSSAVFHPMAEILRSIV